MRHGLCSLAGTSPWKCIQDDVFLHHETEKEKAKEKEKGKEAEPCTCGVRMSQETYDLYIKEGFEKAKEKEKAKDKKRCKAKEKGKGKEKVKRETVEERKARLSDLQDQ